MEELIRYFKPDSNLRVVRKGANILFQGEVPRWVSIVRDGAVRAYTIASNGDERIVSLHSKGDILPLSWAVGQTTNSLFYYDALSDARLMQIPRSAFTRMLEEEPTLAGYVLQYGVSEQTALLLRITGLEQSRAIEKVGFTMYYLLFRYGTAVEGDEYFIDMKLSHATIASLVGLTRESTTKTLRTLKEKGILRYSASNYTVSKTKLEGFLGEDGFRDLNVAA